MVPHNDKYWKVTAGFWGLWGISALPFAHLLPVRQMDAKQEGKGSSPATTTVGGRAYVRHLYPWSLWHIRAR